MKWRDAVWQAVQREAAQGGGVFSRQALLEHRLQEMTVATGSVGATPSQTISRVLQELRDTGAIIFLAAGRYRLASETAQVETFAEAMATQREALIQARIGQGKFRKAVSARFEGKCPLTGIADRELLRASHIIPWNACTIEGDRHEPDNGLLLSCLWDAAFDRGLVSFGDEGEALVAAELGGAARHALLNAPSLRLTGLRGGTLERLKDHRKRHSARKLHRLK